MLTEFYKVVSPALISRFKGQQALQKSLYYTMQTVSAWIDIVMVQMLASASVDTVMVHVVLVSASVNTVMVHVVLVPASVNTVMVRVVLVPAWINTLADP